MCERAFRAVGVSSEIVETTKMIHPLSLVKIGCFCEKSSNLMAVISFSFLGTAGMFSE